MFRDLPYAGPIDRKSVSYNRYHLSGRCDNLLVRKRIMRLATVKEPRVRIKVLTVKTPNAVNVPVSRGQDCYS